MKTSVRAAFVFCVFSAAAACTVQPAQKDAENILRSSGCVRAGVEAGCLVLTDSQAGKTYNLLISGDKPAVGTAISFEGTVHQGPTICMQGTPVKVARWSRVQMQCPPSADAAGKK